MTTNAFHNGNPLTTADRARVSQARVYLKRENGDILVYHCKDDAKAYALWLGMGRQVKLAFRAKGDKTPVYSHDYVTG